MAEPDPGAERRERLAAARLYLVCDSSPGGRALPEVLRGAVAGGVDVVQLREKHLSDDELAAVANAARALCERLGALLIVNDRPAVAVTAGADGVHLGQDDQGVEAVRGLVGPDLLIGLSTHSPEQIQAANDSGADYLGVGPVHATPTKPGVAAVGLELVSHASRLATVPFFAIGGIDQENIGDVLAAGARRVAVVRAIAEAEDVQEAARALSHALARGRAESGAAPA
jgi:thiamine-phosphate pyrophosphorylase